ncbi:hypothetical protein GCM10009836_56150 [Pseudonocardia ailaonensis]|uniref:ANTAR domain-containing protein n=1 Tax=Pseudonocardia ailaonensis TaxID=367279 RepID=A0ABN2NJR3_9PSEU
MPDDLDPSRPDEALLERVAQLETALRSRPVIEQAKGMLMLIHGCDDDGAFRMLIAASQSTNRKLRDVAVELVAHLPKGTAPPADIGAAIETEASRLVNSEAGRLVAPEASGSPAGGSTVPRRGGPGGL